MSRLAPLLLLSLAACANQEEEVAQLQSQVSELESALAELDTRLSDADAAHDAELASQADEIAAVTEGIDLTDLADQVDANTGAVAEVHGRVAAIEDAPYATEGWVEAQGYGSAADIAANAGDIASNAGDIAANATDISINAAAVAANSSDIGINSAGVASNSSAISTNGGDIGALESDLSALEGDVSDLEDELSDLQDNMLSGMDYALFEYVMTSLESSFDQGNAGFLMATAGGAFHLSGYHTLNSSTNKVYFVTFYVNNPGSDVDVTLDFCRGDGPTIYLDGSSVASPSDLDGNCASLSPITFTSGSHQLQIRYRDSNNDFEGLGISNSWIADYGLEMDYAAMETAMASGI